MRVQILIGGFLIVGLHLPCWRVLDAENRPVAGS